MSSLTTHIWVIGPKNLHEICRGEFQSLLYALGDNTLDDFLRLNTYEGLNDLDFENEDFLDALLAAWVQLQNAFKLSTFVNDSYLSLNTGVDCEENTGVFVVQGVETLMPAGQRWQDLLGFLSCETDIIEDGCDEREAKILAKILLEQTECFEDEGQFYNGNQDLILPITFWKDGLTDPDSLPALISAWSSGRQGKHVFGKREFEVRWSENFGLESLVFESPVEKETDPAPVL